MAKINEKKSNREHSFDFELAGIVGIEKSILLKNFDYWCEENERRKIISMQKWNVWWTSESLNSLARKYAYMKKGNLSRWIHQLNEDRWILLHSGEKGNNFYAPGPVYKAWNCGEDWEQVFQNETGRCFKMKQAENSGVFQNEIQGVFQNEIQGVFQNEIANSDVENDVENDVEEITPLSENGKTVVTLHAPDQIENTFLHVVETVSFDAADYEKDFPGGPFAKPDQNPEFSRDVSKETPALQNAGTFEASIPPNPPPIFFNPDLQRRYNGATPTNGKAQKGPAQDRTAQILAEFKTTEVLNFFHAIHADWQRWTAYKRREKKGSYRSAETEAVAIGQLYKKVNGNAQAARDAIEYSIAQTYTGIWTDSSARPNAEPCARYSMQDGPRATTPEEMTMEISRFYNANKDKYASLLRHPGMERYTVPKLKEAVSLFCASRIKQNRGGETFQQQHAALEQHFLFLIKREREDAAKQAGPQSYNPADLRAAEKRGR